MNIYLILGLMLQNLEKKKQILPNTVYTYFPASFIYAPAVLFLLFFLPEVFAQKGQFYSAVKLEV